MKRFLVWTTALGLLSPVTIVRAQQGSQAQGAAENSTSDLLENGTILYLELSKTVDAKKAKAGDAISAVLINDVVSHGKITLRRDTKLVGHVTEAQAHTKDNPESRLGIAFDKILPKGGQEIPFSAALIALRPAPRIQIDAPSAPAPPGVSPAGSPPPDRHYPMPKGPTPKMNTTLGREVAAGSGVDDTRISAIDGLTLEPSADGSTRVVVSFKQTVKLESGVRLELRLGNRVQ